LGRLAGIKKKKRGKGTEKEEKGERWQQGCSPVSDLRARKEKKGAKRLVHSRFSEVAMSEKAVGIPEAREGKSPLNNNRGEGRRGAVRGVSLHREAPRKEAPMLSALP